MRKKKTNKKEDNKIEEIKEKVDVLVTEVGEVLNITADENNPIGDGKEFKDGSDN
jgi:hypothetical protein